MSRALRTRVVSALFVALLALSTPLGLTACSSPQTGQVVARASVLSAGAAVETLGEQTRAAYVTATNRLRAEIRDAGGTQGDYAQQVATLDAAQQVRSRALDALTEAVYGAAGVLDAAAASARPIDYRRAAATLLAAIDDALAVLADGTVLPHLELPTSLVTLVGRLRALAGPTLLTDAGG